MRHNRRARSDAMAQSSRGERRGLQIGPRIRVGGTLGKIGENVKQGAIAAAKNPWVQGGLGLVTGGLAAPVLAGVAGAALTHGAKGSDILKGGIQGAAAGKAGSALKSGLSAATAGKGVTGLFRGGGADGQGNFGAIGDYAGKLASGGLPGAVSGLGNFLGGSGGMNLLGAAQGVNAAALQGQSNDYAKNALSTVQDSYNQRAPLRVAGLQGMLKPQTNDISSLTAHSGPYGSGMPAIKPAAQFSGSGSMT